jgi:predicted O-linked N-acetylglucosamine transferase (SPINDLY family)
MDILEKILTGNLGYGSVVLIVMLFVGVYQQFIVPKLDKADLLEEKKNAEILELQQLVKSKDILLEESIESQKLQTQAIEKLADSNVSQVASIENLSNLENLKKIITRIQDEIERLVEKTREDSIEIKQGIKHESIIIERLKEGIENKLEPLLKEGNTEAVETRNSIQKNIRDLNTQRYNDQTQISTSLINISNELSELKSLTSVQLNSRLLHSRSEDGTMQELK